MKPRLRSRLSGRAIAALPERVIQDLFDMADPPAARHLRVVPDGLRAETGCAFLGRPPGPLETEAIQQVVARIGDSAPWSRWAEAIPLVPDLDARVHLHPLEKEALAELPHLQHVCHRPRLHLRVEEERVQVARARRIPARAASALVAHPGDWEHRTLRSIQPTRILAVQVEDEWNLYENRMAVRLVDHLLAWLGRRLDELQRLAKMAEEGREFDDETRGSRFRGRRLYTLWGKLCMDDAQARELADTLAALLRLQRSLQALLDSPLYREIPRSASVPAALVPTNILANDPHYRKVAVLWRAWARYGHVPGLTREELRAKRQDECRSFDAFALLIVVHALQGLGYKGEIDAVLPGGIVDLCGPLGRARLIALDGELRFEIGADALRIIPVLAQIERDDAVEIWEQIRAQADRPGDTVVLLLGRPEDLERLDRQTARALGGWKRPRVLPISPWSLDCAERVARILGGWEAPRRLGAYPPRAKVHPGLEIELPKWMVRVGDTVAVAAMASAEEQRAFGSACERREAILRQEQLMAQRRRGGFDPGLVRSIAELRDLAGCVRQIERWVRCPVCGNAEGNDFRPRSAGDRWEKWSFWCCCANCSSQWGLHVCGACGRAFPVLSPNVSWRSLGADEPKPDWLDRSFGRDLWAEPCWNQGERNAFRCTLCAACPDATRERDA